MENIYIQALNQIISNQKTELKETPFKMIKFNSNIKIMLELIEKMTKAEQKISALIKLLGLYDYYTKIHAQNVAHLSKKIAINLNLTQIEIKNSYLAGLLHDIGKTMIPLKILNKKKALTEAEFLLIKKHSIWGYQILKEISDLKEIANYVLYHHEKWNGEGYPKGLKTKEIPLIAQIVALADAWDAMCSDRPYKKAMPQTKALVQIKANMGQQFSPQIVKIFLDNLKIANN